MFSDQWFVVALHRRGVPETRTIRGAPVVMRTNGRPAAPDDPNEVINYISNEGVRISRVLARVRALAAEGAVEVRSTAERVLEAVTRAAGSVEDGPFAMPTARVAVLEDPTQTVGGAILESFEIVHRKIELFPDDTGYNPKLLIGHPIPLPTPSAHLRQELAPRLEPA